MKKRLFALLCALMLLPALCLSEGAGQQCDGCDRNVVPVPDAAEPGYREDGSYGRWIRYVCPECGNEFSQIERGWQDMTDPAPAAADPPVAADPPAATDPPAAAEPVTEPEAPAPVPASSEPAAVHPEAPVSVPSQAETQAAQQPEAAVLPPAVSESASGSASSAGQESLPPVVSSDPGSTAAAGSASAEAEAPAAEAPESGAFSAQTAGTWTGTNTAANTRNLAKYPVFSSFWPSRRLNLEGDPDAQASAAGTRVSSGSLLKDMVGGD